MSTFPPPPKPPMDDAGLARWLLAVGVWGAAAERRVAALEAAAAADVADGTDFSSFRHEPGNSSLSPWNVANMVAGGGLNFYATPVQNRFYALPFIAPRRGGIITALAWDSNAAAGNSRIAVYGNNAPDDLYPGSFLGETGSKANTGGATVVSTSNLNIGPLTAGELYWLAYVTDSAAASVRKLDPAAASGMLGGPLANITTNPGVKVAFTFGAPPAAFPSGGTYIDTTTDFAPALGYRVS